MVFRINHCFHNKSLSLHFQMISMYGFDLKSETANKRWQKNTTTFHSKFRSKLLNIKTKSSKITKKKSEVNGLI